MMGTDGTKLNDWLEEFKMQMTLKLQDANDADSISGIEEDR